MNVLFKNYYSQAEVEAIFKACNNFDECAKAVDDFLWLINNSLQMKSDHLRRVSNARLNHLVKRL